MLRRNSDTRERPVDPAPKEQPPWQLSGKRTARRFILRRVRPENGVSAEGANAGSRVRFRMNLSGQ